MNNKLYVNNLDLLKKEEISHGCNGICYKTQDNMVFKQIYNPNEKNLLELSKLYSPSFIFPSKLVYYQNRLIGYIMEYVDGVTIKNIDLNIKTDDYIKQTDKIENEIAVLTNYRVHLLDVGINNIMIDKNGNIKIIDTDFYSIKSKLNNLYSLNLISYNYGVLYPITDISKNNFKSVTLNKYSKLVLCGKMLPSDFIIELENFLNKENLEHNNLYEIKRNLKKL